MTPPAVETFEPDANAAKKDDSGFRYTYPVRDSGSGEIYTEQPKPQAPRSAAQVSQATDSAPTADFETVGDAGMGSAYNPDIGEGIFERSPFRYSFAVYEGYNSNVNTQQDDGVASMYTMIAAGIGYEFGTSRLELTTSLSAGLTFYYDHQGLDNNGLFPTINFILAANYAATPRLDLSFATTTSLLSGGNYSTAGAPNSFEGSYILSDTVIGAKYLWLPKLATETTYNPRIYYFMDQGYNDTQGRIEQTVAQQFLFLWKPTTTLVAEYRFDTRNYYTATHLDSLGNYALLGFDHTPHSVVAPPVRLNHDTLQQRLAGALAILRYLVTDDVERSDLGFCQLCSQNVLDLDNDIPRFFPKNTHGSSPSGLGIGFTPTPRNAWHSSSYSVRGRCRLLVSRLASSMASGWCSITAWVSNSSSVQFSYPV